MSEKLTPPPTEPGSTVRVRIDEEPVIFVRDYKGCWYPTLVENAKSISCLGDQGIEEFGWAPYPDPKPTNADRVRELCRSIGLDPLPWQVDFLARSLDASRQDES